jgi:hypothetical protein
MSESDVTDLQKVIEQANKTLAAGNVDEWKKYWLQQLRRFQWRTVRSEKVRMFELWVDGGCHTTDMIHFVVSTVQKALDQNDDVPVAMQELYDFLTAYKFSAVRSPLC